MNTNQSIRVLIADDSAYMRKVIRQMLEAGGGVQVVGAAHNGLETLELARELQPDVIMVDLYMPEVDGVEFIRRQMNYQPLPIVVCSSTSVGSDYFFEAMQAGAVEFVQKPTALALDKVYQIQNELRQAVAAAAAVPREKLASGETKTLPVDITPALKVPENLRRIDAVVIGLSTGGPRALHTFLPQLPANLPVPVAIALHIPLGYTKPMAETLGKSCRLEVVESQQGMPMLAGRVILAKAGLHTRLSRRMDGTVITVLSEEPKDSPYCPSVDILLRSGADVYGRKVLGVVLTGMGNDGTAGAAWIKAQGGLVYAEAENSSVIYGMPRSVVEAGLADRVVSLAELPKAIVEALK